MSDLVSQIRSVLASSAEDIHAMEAQATEKDTQGFINAMARKYTEHHIGDLRSLVRGSTDEAAMEAAYDAWVEIVANRCCWFISWGLAAGADSARLPVTEKEAAALFESRSFYAERHRAAEDLKSLWGADQLTTMFKEEMILPGLHILGRGVESLSAGNEQLQATGSQLVMKMVAEQCFRGFFSIGYAIAARP